MADTLKSSIAELIGKKTSELKPEKAATVTRSWQNYLASQGYSMKQHGASDSVTGRHIIIYGAADGTLNAVLSDADDAARITPLARLSITKSAKAAATSKES